ncbi:copper/zinc superoxide dismutase [Backusella circina FSU 941]|nr:copper/zinc superoxide dismutase [Backusella circina FSU 941]
MRFSIAAATVAAISLASYASAEPIKAVAYLAGFTPPVFGTIYFTQDTPDSPTMIRANISGLTFGKHGIHIHTFGDLTNGCTSNGPHYNPFNKTHGGPDNPNRHVGDFGNIDVGVGHYATLELSSDLVKLSGDTSVIGRGVVVHSGEDDLGLGDSPLSNTTGNSGDRWACGVIGYASA